MCRTSGSQNCICYFFEQFLTYELLSPSKSPQNYFFLLYFLRKLKMNVTRILQVAEIEQLLFDQKRRLGGLLNKIRKTITSFTLEMTSRPHNPPE
jgi:hypothetical protein